MIFTVWDTETTGFVTKDAALDQQPYIIQFASITGEITPDGVYTERSRADWLIRPPIPIPFPASQVHGIYDRDVVDAPSMHDRIDNILQILNTSDIVIGHNIEYDEGVLHYELIRQGRKGEYTPAQSLCTMRSSTEHCRLRGRGVGYKPPKLSELHRFLFQEYFDGAHNAMVDVEATMRSFVELVRRGVISLETMDVMRLF